MHENNTAANNLFSIDVEAHLKKAASHTFGSPSHYPVEMVRAALKRGASEIDIRLGHTRIQVTDNGSGLNGEELEMLNYLLDPEQPTALKETAIEALQDQSGFGLLAIFAPAPGKIFVENASDLGKNQLIFTNSLRKRAKKTRIWDTVFKEERPRALHCASGVEAPPHFEKGCLKTFNSCDLIRGTRITLFQTAGRSPSLEEHILRAYCRSAPADIRLNNHIISRFPMLDLTQLLASLNISDSKYISRGFIGIPRTGDICRLRLLDQGIPYRYVTLPPHNGFIFDAAVEYVNVDTNTSNEEITREFLDHLAEYAFQLYQWLCQNHTSAAVPIQTRIEELIFDHHRFTRSHSHSRSTTRKSSLLLSEHFSPFKALSSQPLTLSEIKNRGRKSTVFAVPRHKEHLRYNMLGKTVLSLTREQADLLANLEKIPITFLAPVYQKEKRLLVFFFYLKKSLKRTIFNLFGFLLRRVNRGKVLTIEQLTPQEQLFMRTINKHLAHLTGEDKAGEDNGHTIEAVMISSRGLFPSIPSRPLLIRRDHPLVQKAIKAIQSDPRNVEIFAPLMPAACAPTLFAQPHGPGFFFI